MSTAVVVGGGPNGLAAAVALAKEGVRSRCWKPPTRSAAAPARSEAHRARAAARPLLGDSSDGRRVRRSSTVSGWSATACNGDGRRSTARTRSTAETPGVLYGARSTTPPPGSAPTAPRWQRCFGGAIGRASTRSPRTSWARCCGVPKHPLRAGPVRAADGVPGVGVRQVLPHRAGTGAVRRRCGTHLSAAALPDDLGDRARHHHRRPPPRLAGRGGRLAVDHRCPDVAARRISAARSRPVCASSRRRQLPPADVTMFDLAPAAVADILGDRLPGRVAAGFRALPVRARRLQGRLRSRGRRALDQSRTRTGRAPCISAGTSPRSPPPSATSTPGGCRSGPSCSSVSSIWPTLSDRSAISTRCGRMPMCPTVIRATPPRRSVAQIERFAPGFRDRIVGQAVRRTTQMAVYNPNYVGGDIVTGAKDIRQLTFGPRTTLNPYRLGVPGMFICSAATPPGPGAHGMCGANAATDALNHLHHRS